jgi:membrane protein DedA with SNARE-associated domain
MSATLAIVLMVAGAALSAIAGFFVGYSFGTTDTRQEILERDPWE